MDPSRGKRKSKTLLRGRSSRPVQKSDDGSLPTVREKAAHKNLENKGEQLCIPFLKTVPTSAIFFPIRSRVVHICD
jgi:hypothetical protein